MKDKLAVYHFSVGREGGVHTVIKNIVAGSLSEFLAHKVIYLIDEKSCKNNIQCVEGSHEIFRYETANNLYYTINGIKKLIKSPEAILACHDWLELALVGNIGLPNPVIFFMHGDYSYYYETALKNDAAINLFIAPTLNMKRKLAVLLPHRADDILHQPFPVKDFNVASLNHQDLNCAYYVCDLNDENKNFKALPKIDAALKKLGCRVKWHIAGGGMTEETLLSNWHGAADSSIKFYGFLTQDKIPEFLASANIFILPSYKEGMPLSLMESMKAGLVPIISHWNDAVSEIVKNQLNGFIVEPDDINTFAHILQQLSKDMPYLSNMSRNAKITASTLHNDATAISAIEEIIMQVAGNIYTRVPVKVYGSRLDNSHIPNFITRMYRNFTNRKYG